MEKKRMSLSNRILVSMVLGLVVGVLISVSIHDLHIIPEAGYAMFQKYSFAIVGQIFIKLITVIVIPIVVVSLTLGILELGDGKKVGKIGGKTVLFYLITTVISIIIGILLAKIINPGGAMHSTAMATGGMKFTPPAHVGIDQTIENIFPTNPIAAMAQGNMLQVIVFSILFGLGLAKLGEERVRPLKKALEILNEAIIKMVEIIMSFAPYGVFCLLVTAISTQGMSTIVSLLAYMITVVLGLLIVLIVIFTYMLKFMVGMSPKVFYGIFKEAMLVAFSTSSSNATLPVNMDICEKKFGVNLRVCGFTLPLGATINMNGTAIMQGVATIFISEVYGVHLSIMTLILVVITAVLASVGTAGVPSGAIVMLSTVLLQAGLPLQGIALVFGVDRLVDMCRTVVNITGDAVCTLAIAKSEGEIKPEFLHLYQK